MKHERFDTTGRNAAIFMAPAVAKRYGISDVALAKICRKLDIPRPPLGYWMRKEHGCEVEQAPLPPLRPGVDDVATISPPPPRPRLSPEMQARLADIGPELNSVFGLTGCCSLATWFAGGGGCGRPRLRLRFARVERTRPRHHRNLVRRRKGLYGA